MKNTLFRIFTATALATAGASAQTTGITFTNFIRQIQMPSGVEWELSNIESAGQRESGLSVMNDGARFELWTIRSSPLTSYLLDSKFVGAYIPSASIEITSADPYTTIPRTRADKPFKVTMTVSGLSTAITAPAAARSVTFLRHIQSYGTGGVGLNLDRTLATLMTQSSITGNVTQTIEVALTSVPGTDRAKLRGEERFSIFSVADILSPSSQLASKYIQVWPVADGSITGITDNEAFRNKIRTVTVSAKDLYPDSRTYLQINKVGSPESVVVPSSVMLGDGNKPKDDARAVDLDSYVTSDGQWAIELLTVTPFGTERLAKLGFSVNRSLQVNSLLGTME